MLAVFAIALTLQQAAGAVAWESPSPEPETTNTPVSVRADLPEWAIADPFGWERSQCSPLVRRDATLEGCQARVRSELSAALGDRLPAGLRPAGEPVPCLATPADDGSYPVHCGVPERRATAVALAPVPDCRPRPTRQGGAVAFVTECRTENAGDGGLSFRLFGKD